MKNDVLHLYNIIIFAVKAFSFLVDTSSNLMM